MGGGGHISIGKTPIVKCGETRLNVKATDGACPTDGWHVRPQESFYCLPLVSALTKGYTSMIRQSEVKRKVSGRARGRMVRQRREMDDGREEVGQQ